MGGAIGTVMHSSEYNVFDLVTLKEQHQQRNSSLERLLKINKLKG